MRINVLILTAIVSGNLVISTTTVAEQANKNRHEQQITQHFKTEAIYHKPNAEDAARSDLGASWGFHEPLKNCVACHGEKSEQNSTDKMNLIMPMPALCYTCHDRYDTPGGWVHGPVATDDCLLCHTAHTTNNESLLNKPIPELCYNCHEPESIQVVPNHADATYAHCNVCHDGHIGESTMLLKSQFLNADTGLVYLSKDSSTLPQPLFVDSQNSLAGLGGVEIVLVIDGEDLLKRYGVSEDLVRTEIERQLRQNGIKALNHTEQAIKQPSLQIYLRLMEVPSFRQPGQVTALSGSFSIFLQQTVELLPAPGDVKKKYCTAITWNTGAILIWGTSQIKEGLKEAVEVLVGRFGKDYLIANPHTRSPAPVSGE